jgi:hypothetical protein
MVQPLDSASVIEGTTATQPGLAARGLSNLSSEFSFPSLLPGESYLLSSPWIEEPSTVVPNRDMRATLNDQRESTPSPVFRPLRVDVSRRNIRVQALQRWTGRVEGVMGDRFVAIVSDVTTPTNPAEEVELDVGDVSWADQSLIKEGAIFYWAIVYRDTNSGQRERISTIRFARQPKLSDSDVSDIFGEADKIAELLESA